MGNMHKSVTYIRKSIWLFGIIDGMRYSWHFFLSHFCRLNDGNNHSVVRISYNPERITGNLTNSKKIKNNLFYRPNTSDVPLISNILIGILEYDISFDEKCFDCVLDLGANIGLFSILYAEKYKDKSFLAVEPEKNNYILLKKNVEQINTIQTVCAGIWYRKADLVVKDNGNNWGFTVEEADGQGTIDVSGVDIDSLCEQYNLDGNLIVKMDIEGSEINIFKNIENAEWIDRTYALIIEIHDSVDGANYKMICEKMDKRGFNRTSKGENIVFIRK